MKLDPLERLRGLTVPGRRRAADWIWTTPESGVLRTPCGNVVQVQPRGWRCGPPCFRNSTEFLEINEVGGATVSVPYQTYNRQVYRLNKVEASVFSTSPANQAPQMTSTTVAVRDLELCIGSGERSDLPGRP